MLGPMRSTLLALIVVTGIVAAAQTPQPWALKVQPLQWVADVADEATRLRNDSFRCGHVDWRMSRRPSPKTSRCRHAQVGIEAV